MPLATGLVVGFVVITTWWGTSLVEADLTRRAQAALATAGIPAEVSYSGVDAVLGGSVNGAGRAAAAIGVVAHVRGTRHVTLRTIVTGTGDPAGATPHVTPSSSAGGTSSPPSLSGATSATATSPAPPAAVRLPAGTIRFASNDAVLSADARAYLDEVARVLVTNPTVRVVVRGHSDSLGSDEVNFAVSDQRAGAVIAYLASRQVPVDRLRREALAATSPVAPNDTPEGRAANRRVELAIEEVA